MPEPIIWTVEKEVQLLRLRAEGLSGDALGAVFNVSRGCILTKLRALHAHTPGDPPVKRAKARTPEREAILRAGVADGLTLSQIGDKLGVAKETVRYWMRSIGLKPLRASIPVFTSAGNERERDTKPLPPGDPISWGAITAGTCLAGTTYPQH